jgi:hypothetical protein
MEPFKTADLKFMGLVSIICLACTKSTQFIVKAFQDSTVSKILHCKGSQLNLFFYLNFLSVQRNSSDWVIDTFP